MKYVILVILFTSSGAYDISFSFPNELMQNIEKYRNNIVSYSNEMAEYSSNLAAAHTIPFDNDKNMSEYVEFFVYTRNNRDEGQQIWINNTDSIAKSNFNASINTKIIIHGWLNNHSSPVNTLIKNAFLEQDSYNVILVDWGKIANLIYPVAVAEMSNVGSFIGEMIVYLDKDMLDIKKLTMVGHSLGAHMVGLAARHVNNAIKKSVLHTVGLDPANPGFAVLARSLRMGVGDADHVEVVHSNTGINGLPQPIGHLDFYPNSFFARQPGCGVDLAGVCAHSRAYLYYAEALRRPSQWLGIKCDSFTEFLAYRCTDNEVASFPLWTANFTRSRGTYVLVTNSTEPYGLGLKGIDPYTQFEVMVN